MPVMTEAFVYGVLSIPRFDEVVPVAYAKGNRKDRYVPFRIMCGILDIERTRQLAIVKKRYGSALRSLPLETVKGVRPALWIRTGECALWIGGIDPSHCKLETAEKVQEFKVEFTEAAEKLLFDGPRKSPDKRGMFAHSERMEYLFSCLACGAGHRMIAQNGEVTLERYEF